MEKQAAEFAEYFPEYSESTERTSAYWVVNSVWSNKDLPGEFRQNFLDDIAKTCYSGNN